MSATARGVSLAVSLALTTAAFAHGGGAEGVVSGGGYYKNALVCVDLNDNARCDRNEPSSFTDRGGAFSLRWNGPVVAEIIPGYTTFRDQKTGDSSVVRDRLTFRAPSGETDTVSAISTELVEMAEANHGDLQRAAKDLAARVGVPVGRLLEDFAHEGSASIHDALENETTLASTRIADAVDEAGEHSSLVTALRNRLVLDDIKTVVVIYAENRSFDNTFGTFPGANGLRTPKARSIRQIDRDGHTVLAALPPAWGGLTAAGQPVVVTQAQTTDVWPNGPFQIDTPRATALYGYSPVDNSIITRDLYHRFFEHIMQIDGGRNDQFVAWADSGGLVMGYFDGSRTKLWDLAPQYTLADNFFQAAYGGSFLNHQYLICACAPTVSANFVATNKPSINVLGTPVRGVPQLVANPTQMPSARDGATSLKTGNVAPLDYFGTGDGYRAVNTMQPAWQPSGNAPASPNGNDVLVANPAAASTLEPQTQVNIGDELSGKGVSWAWYAGGWGAAAANPYTYNAATKTFSTTTIYKANTSGTADESNIDFQAHHQPFNYFANFDPVTHAADRVAHLKDRSDLVSAIASGRLPAVSFYKPVGFQNQHPGYTNLSAGDAEIVNIIDKLRHSPQWDHMLVVVTYDEFGGQWDHVTPPKGDKLGPGTRIPALIISPFARRDFVDHTQYDTASILRFITHRYSLTPLAGLTQRDKALVENGNKPMGYLGGALRFSGSCVGDGGHHGHDASEDRLGTDHDHGDCR